MVSPNATALLLLDLQNEMVDPAGKIGSNGLGQAVKERGVLKSAARSLQAARAAGINVVHVRLGFRADYADALSPAPRIAKLKASGAAVLGSWGAQFPNEIEPAGHELIITKQCVNPFFNTFLMNWLFANKVSHLVLGGVVTNLVVESTARAADDAGFAVTILEDCCAAPNSEWHRFSVENILPLFGKITTASKFFAQF